MSQRAFCLQVDNGFRWTYAVDSQKNLRAASLCCVSNCNKSQFYTQAYRSGHNGADSKSVCHNRHVSSNLTACANKKELLSTKSSFFVYPSRRLGISSPREVRRISSAPLGLYLITRQRASTCGLMIYNTSCW